MGYLCLLDTNANPRLVLMRSLFIVFISTREYIKKYDFVSSACRLTTEEELLLLKMCTPTLGHRLPTELVNRNAYVSAVSNIGTLPIGKTLSVKVGIDKPPVIDNFDSGADTSILDNPKNCMIGSKLFGAAYSRPEEVCVACVLFYLLREYTSYLPTL